MHSPCRCCLGLGALLCCSYRTFLLCEYAVSCIVLVMSACVHAVTVTLYALKAWHGGCMLQHPKDRDMYPTAVHNIRENTSTAQLVTSVHNGVHSAPMSSSQHTSGQCHVTAHALAAGPAAVANQCGRHFCSMHGFPAPGVTLCSRVKQQKPGAVHATDDQLQPKARRPCKNRRTEVIPQLLLHNRCAMLNACYSSVQLLHHPQVPPVGCSC